MKMKNVCAALLAGMLTLSLAACGGTASDTEGTAPAASGDSGAQNSADGGQHTVAVILKTLNSEYWSCVAAGIKQAEADFGCKVLLQGPPSESSYDEQYNMIETTLASSDVEALVLAPLQPDAAADAVKNAAIPILAVDTTFTSDKLISYVGVSNEDAAKAGGKYMAEKLGGKGNVVILAGVEGDTTSEDRIKGWTEGLEEGGCKVLSMQYTDAATDKAVTAMEGLMQQYPDGIDAVVCHSDDVAMGAANAIAQAGKSDKIKVCGFGGISGAQPVKDGTLNATVDIGPYKMGYDCVARALDAIEGKQIEKFYASEPSVIDSSNIDDFLVKLAEWTK
ncbi:MAG: sugar ABC transporter substrate-binding protein [Intestinibacillus sp.]